MRCHLDLIEDLSRGNSWLSFARGSSQIDYDHGEYSRAAGATSVPTGSAGVPPAGFGGTRSGGDRGSSPNVSEGARGYSSDRAGARKDNTNYTGKTYNSADSIAEFFKQRATQLGNTSGSFDSTRHVPGPKSRVQSPKHQDRGSKINPRNSKPETSGDTSPLPFTHSPVDRSPLPASAGGSGDFVPGSYVRHAKYGRGLVLRREGAGDSSKLTVTFPGFGQKKLIQKYAGLEKA